MAGRNKAHGPTSMRLDRFSLHNLCQSLGGPDMNGVHVKFLLMAAISSLFFSNAMVAQGTPYSPKEILPPAPKAESVKITQGPELELVRANWAIIRWTTNNPGGTDQHDAIVHYGTSPNDLDQVANSPSLVTRDHPNALFASAFWVSHRRRPTTIGSIRRNP